MQVNRVRRRRLLKKLRSNLRAQQGPDQPDVDRLTDEQLLTLATRFGTLEEMVALTDPAQVNILQQTGFYDRAAGEVGAMSAAELEARPEELKAQVDEVKRLVEPPRPGPGTHDDAGELVKLRGGPMDGYLVRQGAPALLAGWSSKGRYYRSSPPDVDENGTELATWEPA